MIFKDKIFKERIEELVRQNGYEIEEFYIDKKFFGNIVLIISNGAKMHHFNTDRGEIIFDHKPVKYSLSFDEEMINIDFDLLPLLDTNFLFLVTLIKFFERDNKL